MLEYAPTLPSEREEEILDDVRARVLYIHLRNEGLRHTKDPQRRVLWRGVSVGACVALCVAIFLFWDLKPTKEPLHTHSPCEKTSKCQPQRRAQSRFLLLRHRSLSALRQGKRADHRAMQKRLERYLKQHPKSTWRPELIDLMLRHAFKLGWPCPRIKALLQPNDATPSWLKQHCH